MPSLFKMLDSRSESHPHTENELNDRSHRTQRRHLQSTSRSAACRGLYAISSSTADRQKRNTSCLAQIETSGRVNPRSGDDANDPIIKCSMYPQMIGKRRSELEAQARTSSTKHDREIEAHRHERLVRTARRQQVSSRVRPQSEESDFSFSSGYSSDGNPEGLPVRVCIYPQAKYIVEPVKTTTNSQQPPTIASTWSSSHALKRSSLPGDEYQKLVRRQKMQRAREVLHLHYAHNGFVRNKHIQHGMMQNFTMRNSERRRESKIRHAVRQALRVNLNLLEDTFKLAMNRRADGVYFCELSDVDGVPIEERMLHDFIRRYQEAQDAACAPKPSDFPCNRTIQRTQIDERHGRIGRAALALQRTDNTAAPDAPGKHPLVSKFSWDSDDGQVDMRERLTTSKH
ncbi:hypothetical protein C7974DRAFT_379092 [Boeremia exigua]|uniref:uncharacterized protein n=1 Tax=Boeremia exigua TaxID=749465 RepID=UPI001E8E30A8|nr:uncharacterized protein C7974DRAFT_379092 [Boeremia exigua]KAH6618965.1 hypothetical protein C7974DRAFT_379092 [Boeremia exigua]